MKTPEDWEHITGYRLNADGKYIKYEKDDRTIKIPAELDEEFNNDPSKAKMGYLVWYEYNDKEEIVDRFYDKTKAKDLAYNIMEKGRKSV